MPARITALCSALEYLRSPPRTLITDGPFCFSEFPAPGTAAAALTITTCTGLFALVVCATSVCFVRSSTITGAFTELPCCHSRTLPLKVAAPVECFSSALSATTCVGPCAPKFALQAPRCRSSPASSPEPSPAHVAFTLPCATASPDSCDTFSFSEVSSSPPSVTRGSFSQVQPLTGVIIVRVSRSRTQNCLFHVRLCRWLLCQHHISVHGRLIDLHLPARSAAAVRLCFSSSCKMSFETVAAHRLLPFRSPLSLRCDVWPLPNQFCQCSIGAEIPGDLIRCQFLGSRRQHFPAGSSPPL